MKKLFLLISCLIFVVTNIFASTKLELDNQILKNEIAKLTDDFNSLNWVTEQKTLSKKAHELEKLFETYLAHNPYDTYMWLKFAIFEEGFPFRDYIRGVECLKKVLSYDPNNAYAAVLLTIFHDNNTIVDEECYNLLCTIKTEDNESKAMIEYAKSLYHELSSKKSLEHSYKASYFWREHVKEFLSKYTCDDYYLTSDEKVRANLQVILNGYPGEGYDFLNVELFLNEFVREKITLGKLSDLDTKNLDIFEKPTTAEPIH